MRHPSAGRSGVLVLVLSVLAGCSNATSPDAGDASRDTGPDVSDAGTVVDMGTITPDVQGVDIPRVFRDVGVFDVPSSVPPGCGNRRVDPGEECDDGNLGRWDGCSDTCKMEQSLRVQTADILRASSGCDLTNDMVIDNQFSTALGPAAVGILNSSLHDSLENGGTIILGSIMDLDDRLGANDPMVRVAFFLGTDATPPFLGAFGEDFIATGGQLDTTGTPLSLLSPGTLTNHALVAGPGSMRVALTIGSNVPSSLSVRRVRTTGTTTANAELRQIDTIEDGIICGAIPAGDLDRILPAMAIPANCRGPNSSMLDVLVLGCPFVITGGQPDIDIDGDGVYNDRALRDTNNDKVIDTCYDGTTGTVITGDDCVQSMPYDDAFSMALRFSAISVVITSAN